MIVVTVVVANYPLRGLYRHVEVQITLDVQGYVDVVSEYTSWSPSEASI